MQFVIHAGESYYRCMEDGRPVIGVGGDVPTFDEIMAPKICDHLSTFRGDVTWHAQRIIPVDELIGRFKTLAACGRACGRSASAIAAWRDAGKIPLTSMHAAQTGLNAEPE